MVRQRITRHPERRGETGARWEMVRSSLCSARAPASDEFRRGNVRSAGDAARLVPSFGVRGTHSGLEDAAADDGARTVFPAGPLLLLAAHTPSQRPSRRRST